jgi:hypothetical protein
MPANDLWLVLSVCVCVCVCVCVRNTAESCSSVVGSGMSCCLLIGPVVVSGGCKHHVRCSYSPVLAAAAVAMLCAAYTLHIMTIITVHCTDCR